MPLPAPIIEVLAVCAAIVYRADMEETDDEVSRNEAFPGTSHRRGSVARKSTTVWQPTGAVFIRCRSRARWSRTRSESPVAPPHRRDLRATRRSGALDLVIDETLERRWGHKRSLRGHYRDSLLSSREQEVRSPGLRWIVMAVVVTLPWTIAVVGIAILQRADSDSRRKSNNWANGTKQ
jgi:hypothetical protein